MSFWINGVPMKYTVFPNNERMPDGKFLYDLVGTRSDVTIRWSFLSDMDFLMLMFIVEHLKHGIGGARPIRLDIDYFPYSRMDRSVIPSHDVFTLKYVAQLINWLEFDLVRVVEPHSDVVMALLDNAEAVSPIAYLTQPYHQTAKATILPDAGAEKRYGALGLSSAVFVGHKRRNFATGAIESITIPGLHRYIPMLSRDGKTPSAEEQPIVIVDDLCSRGGTFVGLIKELRGHGWVHPVDLVVPHLENTVRSGELLKYVRRIITTDSMHAAEPHPQITVVKLTNIFEDWGR